MSMTDEQNAECRMQSADCDSAFCIQHSAFFWPRLYALVLGELALTILLFYIFTKAFA
jgi:hypothetical protein